MTRPNVFPNSNDKENTNPQSTQNKVNVDAEYELKRDEVAQEVYYTSTGDQSMDASVQDMYRKTQEQIRLRDEALKRNQENVAQYQNKFDTAQERRINTTPQPKEEPKKVVLSSEPKPIVKNTTMTDEQAYYERISQPQYNQAYDVIPIPSGGKVYKSKKSAFRVAYLTAADENILTSPNLLKSGKFLEILINRKLLETEIRYNDLTIGDRNAIMIWLRASAYGEMYPVTLVDNDDIPFETEIDLNTLKFKPLGAEPDGEGYFDFMLPRSKKQVKFKFLTLSDIDDIDEKIENDKNNGELINYSSTYTLEKHIVEVDGVRDRGYIKDFVEGMRIGDSDALRTYIEEIESGVELKIKVETPRGGSLETFLPLNIQFFWPKFKL